MENNDVFFVVFNLRNSLLFLDLHKRSWADSRYNFIGRAVAWDPAVYNPSTNWLDMWGSNRVFLGSNNNIKGTEQYLGCF